MPVGLNDKISIPNWILQQRNNHGVALIPTFGWVRIIRNPTAVWDLGFVAWRGAENSNGAPNLLI